MRKKQINFNELEQSLLLLEGFTLITLCIFFDLEWIFPTVKRTNPGSIFKRHTSSFSCETRTCFVIALRIRTLRSSRTVTMKSALHLVSRTAVFLCCMVDRHWRSEGQGIPVYSYNRLKKKSNFQYDTKQGAPANFSVFFLSVWKLCKSAITVYSKLFNYIFLCVNDVNPSLPCFSVIKFAKIWTLFSNNVNTTIRKCSYI